MADTKILLNEEAKTIDFIQTVKAIKENFTCNFTKFHILNSSNKHFQGQ